MVWKGNMVHIIWSRKSNGPETTIRLTRIKCWIDGKISSIFNLITCLGDQNHCVISFQYETIWNCETWNCAVGLKTYGPPIITLIFVYIGDLLVVNNFILHFFILTFFHKNRNHKLYEKQMSKYRMANKQFEKHYLRITRQICLSKTVLLSCGQARQNFAQC